MRAPLVLDEQSDIRVGLKLRRRAERLLKAAVCARKEVFESRERIDALKRAWEENVDAVVKKVRARFYGVIAALGRDVVNDFIQVYAARQR